MHIYINWDAVLWVLAWRPLEISQPSPVKSWLRIFCSEKVFIRFLELALGRFCEQCFGDFSLIPRNVSHRIAPTRHAFNYLRHSSPKSIINMIKQTFDVTFLTKRRASKYSSHLQGLVPLLSMYMQQCNISKLIYAAVYPHSCRNILCTHKHVPFDIDWCQQLVLDPLKSAQLVEKDGHPFVHGKVFLVNCHWFKDEIISFLNSLPFLVLRLRHLGLFIGQSSQTPQYFRFSFFLQK